MERKRPAPAAAVVHLDIQETGKSWFVLVDVTVAKRLSHHPQQRLRSTWDATKADRLLRESVEQISSEGLAKVCGKENPT